MVRCDPAESEALQREGAEPMEMRGRPMTGWLRVSAEAVAADEVLGRWVGVGLAYAGALPPK